MPGVAYKVPYLLQNSTHVIDTSVFPSSVTKGISLRTWAEGHMDQAPAETISVASLAVDRVGGLCPLLAPESTCSL